MKITKLGSEARSHFTQLAIVKTPKISFWRSPKSPKLYYKAYDNLTCGRWVNSS
ncbi:MAG: hypothetical protein QNJ41_21800 [Xenococcaceae cyanobacterium MO_188.B32]|nr:hypothetical protein [Xenococcaceae cyanobacterium MO_188.B32]